MNELIPFLRQFRDSSAGPQHEPFVYRTEDTLSLHFDPMTVQSEMRRDAPEELILPYTRTMMGFLLYQPRQPQRISMIGLGGGSLAKYCYAKLPDASILVTEINPGVIALRDEFCVPRDDARFRVVAADGANFVRLAPTWSDVLLVDGYDRDGQSAQLRSPRFYDDCHQHLGPDGFIVVNLTAEDPAIDESVARIRCSFKTVVVVDSEDYSNRVAFACKGGALSLPHEQLCARLGELESHHPVRLRDTLQRIRYAQRTLFPA